MSSTAATPLKGALIGYGFIQSRGHVPAYLKRNDVQIVAIADICEERRSIAAETFPEARIYTDAEILLEREAGQLDFVDIATPPAFHASIAASALESGLHVLCEKPLTASLEEADTLWRLAGEKQRVLYPCHNYKHAPVVKAIRETLDSGVIGKVRSVTLNTYRNTHAKGVTEWRTHWRRERRYSAGGIAMDHGSHTLYLTFDWLGGYPTAVTAKMANQEPERYDTEDNFSAVLTFPTGLAHVHLTWTAGVRKVIYTLQGDKGALTIQDDEMEIALLERTSGPDVAQGAVTWKVEKKSIASHWMDASHVEWFNSLFDGFMQAIHKGDFQNHELKDAYQCIQAIMTAYHSAAEDCRELPLHPEAPSPGRP